MWDKTKTLFKLLHFLLQKLEIEKDRLIIKSSGYLIILSDTEISVLSEGNIRANAKLLLLNSDLDFYGNDKEGTQPQSLDSPESVSRFEDSSQP